MSIYPAVCLNQYYSLNLSDDIHLLVEDLSLIHGTSLHEAIKTKKYDNVCVVKDKMYINTVNQIISIVGVKLSRNKYFISSEHANGTTLHIPYTCSEKTIKDGIEVLYHMYQNWSMESKK